MINTKAPDQAAIIAIEQAFKQAIECHQSGHLQSAENLYAAILKILPSHSEANHNMGLLAVLRNHPEDSLPYFNQALDAEPSRGQYWLSYIDALYRSGQLENARQILALAQQQGLQGAEVESLALRLNSTVLDIEKLEGVHSIDLINLESVETTILKTDPENTNSRLDKPNKPTKTSASHRGNTPSTKEINAMFALFNHGRSSEAAALAQKLTSSHPNHADGWKVLGVSYNLLARNADALGPMRKAVELLPNDAESRNNLGIILQALGRLDEAEASYLRALKLNPGYAQAHSNLGACLLQNGRLVEAEASFRYALQIKPDYSRALMNLALTLKDMGRYIEAEAYYRSALELNPNDAFTHCSLGFILHKLSRLNEAETYYKQAIRIDPNFIEAHSNLAATLRDLGRPGEAEISARKALQINPDYLDAHINLGITLFDAGRYTEADACLRRVLQSKPDSAEAHSNLLFNLIQIPTENAEALFIAHCRFGAQFETPFASNYQRHTNSRESERCLQIGFISGDLYNHAVAYFFEPLLAQLSQSTQLSLHAYSNHVIEDSTYQRLRGYFAHWNFIYNLSDDVLAEKIRADGIDILIDLSGHTARNRLLVFARKPAPVQASWIGYPGTTGLRSMDYYFSDRYLLPAGQFDSQFTEKIVRLPASAPFLPSKEAPLVNSLPAVGNGYLTFGSFNRRSKISREVIALWSEILRALPSARMLLGGMPIEGHYEILIEWFAQEGIGRERLDFHLQIDLQSYLTLHHKVDICLDTFPYSGGTTTLHALWMGVPTLTLSGITVASRTGAGILSQLGLESFIAKDSTDFVRKGLFWAENTEELSSIRSNLRERFAQSATGHPELIAAGLEKAMRIMWQRWCEGLPAESFEVDSQSASE